VRFQCDTWNSGEDGLMQAYLELLKKPPVTITKQPLPSTKRFSIRIKTIRHKSAVSYYLNKGDKIYTDEIVKKVGLPCL
jgi:D-alanine-D-alanine ligase